MSDALSEEFFAEVGDKYYPQVLEGLELLGAGEVAQGIEVLSRPLHTIKGVTGFMPGFESASSFTHAVESFLKKLQAGTLPHSADNIALASHGVNSIFAVIEQIRDLGEPDQAEIAAVCEVLEAASGSGGKSGASSAAACLVKEEGPDACVLRITSPRVHLKAQADQIVGAILGLPQTSPVILDLSAVKSFGSGVWENIDALSGMWTICVRGLSGAARETFFAWNLDKNLRLLQPLETSEGGEGGERGEGGGQ